MYGVEQSRTHWFQLPAKPSRWRLTTICARSPAVARTISRDLSSELSSEMISSTSTHCWLKMLSRVSLRYRSPLNVGIATVIKCVMPEDHDGLINFLISEELSIFETRSKIKSPKKVNRHDDTTDCLLHQALTARLPWPLIGINKSSVYYAEEHLPDKVSTNARGLLSI
jgi:hypothetical protein